jgi:hypothetical protein
VRQHHRIALALEDVDFVHERGERGDFRVRDDAPEALGGADDVCRRESHDHSS